MKTATELFDENSLPYQYVTGRFMIFTDLKIALTEHDNEIKELMLDRIKQLHDEIRNHPDRVIGLVSKLSEIERFKRKFISHTTRKE